MTDKESPMTLSRQVDGERRSTTPGRSATKGDLQRGAIIDAVVDLLATVPIADLSVSQITQRAALTRSGFYFYFESKYSVVAAALQQVWQEIDEATAPLDSYDFTEPPAEFSARVIGDAVEVWRGHSVLIDACLHARDSDAQLREMWDSFADTLVHKLSAFLTKLYDAGRVQPATDDIEALTHALVGMTMWALHNGPGESSTVTPDRVLAAVNAAWLAAAWGPSPA